MGDGSQTRLTQAQRLLVGSGDAERSIAYRLCPGSSERPGIVWLGGFLSDMLATKAEAMAAYAANNNRTVLRFDYSGHGESGGRFEDGTISRWLEDAVAVIEAKLPAPSILVGSSMGGWVALLAANVLASRGRPPAGLVLVAPAVDFTERLIFAAFGADEREALSRDGVVMRPSAYGPPVPITRALIEDGRQHLMLDGLVRSHAPVHILQGMRDDDVPWRHAMLLVEHLAGDPVVITLIKDGDHRLSRAEDIAKLIAAVEAIA